MSSFQVCQQLRHITEKQIEIGAHYLLSEFAFMLFLPEFLQKEVVAYIYHRPWPVFEKFISGIYTGEEFKNLQFVQFPEFS